jgi:hypothetical protein
MLDEVLTLRAENARLRAALIQTGNNIGAALSDQVTTDFLMHVPEEARMKIERLTSERDAARRERQEVLDRQNLSNRAEA